MPIVLNGTSGITTPDITAPTTTLSSLNGGQLAGMRNKIINGKMEIAQRGTSVAASMSQRTWLVDRWFSAITADGTATISQEADAPSSNDFQNSFRYTVGTADTSIAVAQYSALGQIVEGYNARDLIGKTFTLSFWVRSSKTGTHCVSFRNAGLDRSYIAEYTISAANTWEFKTVTVSGGLITAGTWNWTNGQGLQIGFTLASGTNLQTTAGAWQTGNFQSTSSQVNCLDSNTNIFAITGVQLEVGSVATPFEHRPYGAELALCQRYYYRVQASTATDILTTSGYSNSTTAFVGILGFPVNMRQAPSALEQSGTAGNYLVRQGGLSITCSAVPSYSSLTTSTIACVVATVASGLTVGQAGLVAVTVTANGYLGWSVEL